MEKYPNISINQIPRTQEQSYSLQSCEQKLIIKPVGFLHTWPRFYCAPENTYDFFDVKCIESEDQAQKRAHTNLHLIFFSVMTISQEIKKLQQIHQKQRAKGIVSILISFYPIDFRFKTFVYILNALEITVNRSQITLTSRHQRKTTASFAYD